jgi:hypothetical protein
MERLRRKGEAAMVENKVEGGENDGEIEVKEENGMLENMVGGGENDGE